MIPQLLRQSQRQLTYIFDMTKWNCCKRDFRHTKYAGFQTLTLDAQYIRCPLLHPHDASVRISPERIT